MNQAEAKKARLGPAVSFFAPFARRRRSTRKASAKSGERMPRFFMSAFALYTILPVEVSCRWERLA
jgi:hypothetical protein